jgi:enoyl-CoA hydratase
VLEQDCLTETEAIANELAHGLISLRDVASGVAAFRAGQGRHATAID